MPVDEVVLLDFIDGLRPIQNRDPNVFKEIIKSSQDIVQAELLRARILTNVLELLCHLDDAPLVPGPGVAHPAHLGPGQRCLVQSQNGVRNYTGIIHQHVFAALNF